MELSSILTELKKPFPATDHKERKLPGGGRWFFVPWQKIRDRLDNICPDWEAKYSDPYVAGDYLVIRCQLTICGVTREGLGNDKAYPETNENGRAKIIGTPPERAAADAFKNAAEQFGIAAYLDDQDFVIRYLQSKGDGRGVRFGLMEPKRTQEKLKDSPTRKNGELTKEEFYARYRSN